MVGSVQRGNPETPPSGVTPDVASTTPWPMVGSVQRGIPETPPSGVTPDVASTIPWPMVMQAHSFLRNVCRRSYSEMQPSFGCNTLTTEPLDGIVIKWSQTSNKNHRRHHRRHQLGTERVMPAAVVDSEADTTCSPSNTYTMTITNQRSGLQVRNQRCAANCCQIFRTRR